MRFGLVKLNRETPMRHLLVLAATASLALSGAAFAQSTETSMTPGDHPGSGTETPGGGMTHKPMSHGGMMGHRHHHHRHHHMMHNKM